MDKFAERDAARAAQQEAAECMLFSMDFLGEKFAGYQFDLDGVVESLVVQRVSQGEFHSIMKAAVAGSRAQRGPGAAAST